MQLVRQAVGAGRRAYLVVNNRCEGNAQLTVERLVEMLWGSAPLSLVLPISCALCSRDFTKESF